VATWEPVVQALFDGRTRLLWDASVHPTVLLRDRATGLVVGIGEGGDFRFDAGPGELEVHYSNGVQSRATTIRRPR
jgi:hypothetical protein